VKGAVPMPPNSSSHRIIVIAGRTAHPLTPICRRSKALLQRPAPRRIIVIRNGQSIVPDLHDRQPTAENSAPNLRRLSSRRGGRCRRSATRGRTGGHVAKTTTGRSGRGERPWSAPQADPVGSIARRFRSTPDPCAGKVCEAFGGGTPAGPAPPR
jgi:hypothetical protein